MSSQPDHHASMLDRIVRIIKLCSYCTNIFTLCIHKKLLHPVRTDHFRIVVQEQQILSFCLFNSHIIDSGIVKSTFIGYNLYFWITFQFFVVITDALLYTVIFHYHDLIIFPGRFLLNRSNTASQIFHMILIRNYNTDQRLSIDRILDLKNSRECTSALHFHFNSIIITHMIMNCSLGRINGVGLGNISCH